MLALAGGNCFMANALNAWPLPTIVAFFTPDSVKDNKLSIVLNFFLQAQGKSNRKKRKPGTN